MSFLLETSPHTKDRGGKGNAGPPRRPSECLQRLPLWVAQGHVWLPANVFPFCSLPHFPPQLTQPPPWAYHYPGSFPLLPAKVRDRHNFLYKAPSGDAFRMSLVGEAPLRPPRGKESLFSPYWERACPVKGRLHCQGWSHQVNGLMTWPREELLACLHFYQHASDTASTDFEPICLPLPLIWWALLFTHSFNRY